MYALQYELVPPYRSCVGVPVMRERQYKALLAAHFENVTRYRRILGTYLTAIEREFVERRLREEEFALFELEEVSRPDCLNVTARRAESLDAA